MDILHSPDLFSHDFQSLPYGTAAMGRQDDVWTGIIQNIISRKLSPQRTSLNKINIYIA